MIKTFRAVGIGERFRWCEHGATYVKIGHERYALLDIPGMRYNLRGSGRIDMLVYLSE